MLDRVMSFSPCTYAPIFLPLADTDNDTHLEHLVTAAADTFDLSSVIKHSNCHSRFNSSALIATWPHDDQQIRTTEKSHMSDTTAVCGGWIRQSLISMVLSCIM